MRTPWSFSLSALDHKIGYSPQPAAFVDSESERNETEAVDAMLHLASHLEPPESPCINQDQTLFKRFDSYLHAQKRFSYPKNVIPVHSCLLDHACLDDWCLTLSIISVHQRLYSSLMMSEPVLHDQSILSNPR